MQYNKPTVQQLGLVLCWCALARVVWRERAWIFVDLVGFSAGLLYDFWHIVG